MLGGQVHATHNTHATAHKVSGERAEAQGKIRIAHSFVFSEFISLGKAEV